MIPWELVFIFNCVKMFRLRCRAGWTALQFYGELLLPRQPTVSLFKLPSFHCCLYYFICWWNFASFFSVCPDLQSFICISKVIVFFDFLQFLNTYSLLLLGRITYLNLRFQNSFSLVEKKKKNTHFLIEIYILWADKKYEMKLVHFNKVVEINNPNIIKIIRMI